MDRAYSTNGREGERTEVIVGRTVRKEATRKTKMIIRYLGY
jgi:hypothetical protein